MMYPLSIQMTVREPHDLSDLQTHLRTATALAEQLNDAHPNDRALTRLCLYLYDALELAEAADNGQPSAASNS